MKLYIATKFEDVVEYNQLKDILTNKNHIITCDWTKHSKVHPFSEHKQTCLIQSKIDLDGINTADAVILLYTGKKGSGMSFELGYATALNKKIFMVSYENINYHSQDTNDYSMFVHLPNFIHCKSYTHLLDALKEYELRINYDNRTI